MPKQTCFSWLHCCVCRLLVWYVVLMYSAMVPVVFAGAEVSRGEPPKHQAKNSMQKMSENAQAARHSFARRDSLLAALGKAESTGRKDTATVRLLCTLANLVFLNKPTEAVGYAIRAESMAEAIGDTRGVALALEYVGLSYRTAGLYAESLECFLRMARLATEKNDDKMQVVAMIGVGQAYAGQEYFDRALEHYHQALALMHRTGDSLRGRVLNNIGVVLRDKKRYDSALTVLFTALPYYAQDSLSEEKASGYYAVLYNIASVYERQKNYALAGAYLLRVQRLAERNNDSTTMIYVYRGLGRVEFGEGRYAEAKHFALQALSIARMTGIRVRENETLSLLADIYGKEGDCQTELRYTKESAVVKDSLIGAVTARQSSLVFGKHFRQQATLEEQAKAREQMLIRNFLIGVSLLLVTLAAVMVNRYRLKSRSERELRQVNDEILRQQLLLEEQSKQIEEMNSVLQQSNAKLSEANVNLDVANVEMQAYIQELHRVNGELDAQNERLQELHHEKDELLGIVAHDLKNPLAYIRLSAEMLTRFGKEMVSDERDTRLVHIIRTVDRMTHSITDLLQQNALETGGIAPTIVPVAVHHVLRYIEEEYRERARQKSIELRLVLLDEQLVALADEQMTFSVLENLVSNALKFSPAHSCVEMRAICREYEHSEGLVVRIEISDEGPGLSEKDKVKLFGKFARLSAKPTGGEHSTGLGLSIVKTMVEAMNGRVWCESELGKGATFIVELPKA